MATEIVTRVLCDFCAADEQETPNARTARVVIDGTAFEIDVCDTHGKPLTELVETLSELGRKLPKRAAKDATKEHAWTDPAIATGSGSTKPSRQPGSHICPACGAGLNFRSSLTSHARSVHGKTLDELEGKSLDYACRADGCDKAFSTPQGVAVHESRVHHLEARGVGNYEPKDG